MRALHLLSIASATWLVSACLVYDESLLPGDGGGSGASSGQGANPGVGGTTGVGGGTDGTGAVTGGGGDTGAGGGTDGTGAMTGTGATTGSGGTGGGTGGDTGGEDCDVQTPGPTGFTTLHRLDSFNTSWPQFNQKAAAFSAADGHWSVSAESSMFTPAPASSVAWESGDAYAERACLPAGNLAFHGTAEDGAWYSADMQFKATIMTNFDMSAYDGVIFYARSDESSQLSIALGDAAGPNPEILIGPQSATWTQRHVAFSQDAGFTPATARIVKFVAKSPNPGVKPIDIWIDDVRFYKCPGPSDVCP